MLTTYHTLATASSELNPDISLAMKAFFYDSPETILRAAELQGLQKTPMWHARVAQALSLNLWYEDALDHFQIFLHEHEKSPSLSAMSLFVIHRDIYRTLMKLGRHKKALLHFELSESLRQDCLGDNKLKSAEYIASLLSAAQMKHLAKLPDDALAAVDKAWEYVLERHGDKRFHPELTLFFFIFLELHQPHRVRSVLDFAFTHFQDFPDKNFKECVLEWFCHRPRIMYRVIHHAVTRDDQCYVDIISEVIGKIDTENSESNIIDSLGVWGEIEILTWQLTNLADLRYFLATLLFEKGQVSQGIQGWYEVAALSNPPNEWDIEPAQNRSICDLATLCLGDEDIPFAVRSPLALDEYSDACLVISSWLHNHGDVVNARNALRGRVRECVSLLSDDETWNDNTAFLSLFKTFLATRDSDEDLGAVLYLIQLDNQRKVRIFEGRRPRPNVLHGDTQGGLSESLERVQVDNAIISDEDTGVDGGLDDVSGVRNWFCGDFMTECSGCRSQIETFHWWYFCRSCPNKGLCRRCYLQFRSPALANPDDAAPSTSDKVRASVCDPHHEFYYTGPYLRFDDLVPEGMMPFVSTTGERKEIWIEEWKDRLAEE